MKYARFAQGGVVGVGVVTADVVQPIGETLDDIIRGAQPTPIGTPVPLDDVGLLAPVPESSRGVYCFGINYVAHQRESAEHFAATVPSDPIVFFKTPSALTGPFADIVTDDAVSAQLDWEVELGVLIGRAGRNIAPDAVADHIFGYTVVNDVTARDLQKRFSQWHIGKNLDATTPVGPWIVTADEIAFPPRLEIALQVDGVVKQRAVTSDMIFSITEQICALSRYIELLPGDLIATGTPAGVGFTRTPAEFLAPGSVVTASISEIGSIVNPVRREIDIASLTETPADLTSIEGVR
ncbi:MULTISPECIES: fumarylacetoacetate hydrolase family protein [Gordonia]|nr:fumarylacetoacetate hydrolase family protein [Gordonia terrae]ANY25013.1 5-carboxymethyl-2-hydroxymuconate isomerase [Gordonia terrae]GAB42400.1 fumarylacetoacetate hydrolase family protein [Gordonia terrae NBRC 100016]VTR07853.1 fumarylacetoacetate hydrolase [Clostridioides difficile]VTS61293.1 4-hydroxyphenylacetate degradation bifunctional isomerase/decarboxylase [Gordonia terrae]